jgi:hypothetical protein
MNKQRKSSKRAEKRTPAKRKRTLKKRKQKGGLFFRSDRYEDQKRGIENAFNAVMPYVRLTAEQFKKNNPQYFQ